LDQNGLLFKKVAIKVYNESNEFQLTQSLHFITGHVTKIHETIQNCKANFHLLSTKEKEKFNLTKATC
jgi:stalled ribosome rescue protein Dom34